VLIERLKDEIKRHGMLEKRDNVLVGVSGGPDSIALLHALHVLACDEDWNVLAVHVNHQLRGEESEEDERYVREFCSRHGIAFEAVRVDVNGVVRQQGGNRQSVARQLRMEAFERIAGEKGVRKLALAHHADDQVETILMRLLRGTGPSGLVGMEPVRKWKHLSVIRPFLSFSRQEIEEYCENHHLHPRFDSSNRSKDYTRNRIRLELIPILHDYNPRFKEALLGLWEIVREEEQVWREWTRRAMEQTRICQDPHRVVLDVSSFLHLPVALQRRIVKLILSYLWNEENHEATLDSVERVRRLAEHETPSARVDLPGGITAEREYGRLAVARQMGSGRVERLPDDLKVALHVPGMSSLPGFLGKIEVIQSSTPLSEGDLRCHDWAVFDGDRLQGPFHARSRQPGDRMSCFGMSGRKKLKDLFMEARIPKRLRDRYPVIVQGETILWVPGVRRSDLAPVTAETETYLYFLWHAEEKLASSEI